MRDLSELTLREFIEQAASAAPAPGGGGAAALAGALGAAMAAMAANFTVGKPRFAKHDELMRQTLASLDERLTALRQAITADAEAFVGVTEAYRLPREGAAEREKRRAAIREALAVSLAEPARVLAECRLAAETLPALAEAANPNLLSDVAVAAILLAAAAEAALENVLVNSRQLGDGPARLAEERARGDLAVVKAAADQARRTLAARQAAAPDE